MNIIKKIYIFYLKETIAAMKKCAKRISSSQHVRVFKGLMIFRGEAAKNQKSLNISSSQHVRVLKGLMIFRGVATKNHQSINLYPADVDEMCK